MNKIYLMIAIMLILPACGKVYTKGNSGGLTNINTMSMSGDSLGKNFKIVESGAVGSSEGLKILFITFKHPSKLEASRDLRKSVTIKGKSALFMNTIEEYRPNNYFLFGYPTITIMSDVIEYTD